MNAGKRRHRVTLSKAPDTAGDADGFYEPLDPDVAFISIDPAAPGTSDSTRIQAHFVTMPYHPQVTVETRILFGARELFVKGVQNVEERNRELRCYCEEAV